MNLARRAKVVTALNLSPFCVLLFPTLIVLQLRGFVLLPFRCEIVQEGDPVGVEGSMEIIGSPNVNSVVTYCYGLPFTCIFQLQQRRGG